MGLAAPSLRAAARVSGARGEGPEMKAIARSLVVILVALFAVPALVVSVTITSAVQLLATTALIMGGTQHPLSVPPDTNQFISDYMDLAEDHYIFPGTGVAPDDRVPVVYPAEVAPFSPFLSTSTLDDSVAAGRGNLGSCLGGGSCNGGDPVEADHFIVYGYSLSAVVASLVKGDLISEADPAMNGTNIVLLSNPSRVNGGILGRGFEGLAIPIIGITFYGETQNSCDTDPCSPTDDFVLPTVDVAQQYDFLGGDAPARLDPLAFANSIAAYALLHGNMPNRSIAGVGQIPTDRNVIYQDTYGDTTYYMVTAPQLPILMLATQAGVPGPVLAIPDALMRVWIEDKYRRDLSPGEHVQFQLSPIGNPVALVGNMLGAIPVGIDDTVQQAGGGFRPLGTADVYRPFGVGGPAYDKTTGVRTTDNIGIPTGAGDYPAAQGPIQTLGAPETGENNKLAIEAAKDQGNVIEEVTPDDNETPEATKPEPFAKLRESFKFDPDNQPLGIRPSGDGPLKRIVNALTGQRPKAAGTQAADDAPAPAEDAA